MSTMRSALLGMLYDGSQVRQPYIYLVRSLIETEFEISQSYSFYDGSLRREGIVYFLGKKEVYWIQAADEKRDILIIRDQILRENILDLLALNPLYRKWFG